MKRVWMPLGAAVLVGLFVAAYELWDRSSPASRGAVASEAAAVAVEPATSPAPPLTPPVGARTSTPPPSAPAARDAAIPLQERDLMTELRALQVTDPTRAIQLAREGDARFPNSADAAERGWVIVKSMVSLGQFHEARDEARVMVQRYRGTSWAEDVERHTLINPLDQPSREEQQRLDQEEQDLQKEQ